MRQATVKKVIGDRVWLVTGRGIFGVSQETLNRMVREQGWKVTVG